jgi:hypothetical protein
MYIYYVQGLEYFVLIILYEWIVLCWEPIICISIISYGKINFDIRVFWITSTFLERIMLAIQGSTVVCMYVRMYVRISKDNTWSVVKNKSFWKKIVVDSS